MAEATVKVFRNGPYVVQGVSKLLDHKGDAYDLKGETTVALCRCGQSSNKPFCDGTHSKCDFHAEETAGGA